MKIVTEQMYAIQLLLNIIIVMYYGYFYVIILFIIIVKLLLGIAYYTGLSYYFWIKLQYT